MTIKEARVEQLVSELSCIEFENQRLLDEEVNVIGRIRWFARGM